MLVEDRTAESRWNQPPLSRIAAQGALPTARDLAGLRPEPYPLHLNETLHVPSPRAIAAATEELQRLNRYPETRGATLAAALAARTGVPPQRIVFGVGSDEILHFSCQIALAPGDEAVVPTPSFPRYRISAAIVGGVPVLVPLAPDGRNDVDAMLAAIGPRTRALFCCTPNNPSGALLDAEEVERLIRGVPEHVLLVVDEAYYEFAAAARGPDILALLARRRGPWLVARTFSKAYALAALRIGYALAGSDEVADALRKVKTTFNVTNLAYVAAEAALADEAHLSMILETCTAERERLAAGMRALGLAPLPSMANFVSVDLRRDAEPVMAAMARSGVLAREWRDPGHETYLRVTVGPPAATEAALAALAAALKEA
jgi:histidinol-phosphate aminotransferase